MKKIRLSVAKRYLRRYTGAHLECVYRVEEASKRYIYPPLFVGNTLNIVVVFTPKSKVFLRQGENRIAQITEGLPAEKGHFDPFTGEFRQGFPY